jgi:hypothetical protein
MGVRTLERGKATYLVSGVSGIDFISGKQNLKPHGERLSMTASWYKFTLTVLTYPHLYFCCFLHYPVLERKATLLECYFSNTWIGGK